MNIKLNSMFSVVMISLIICAVLLLGVPVMVKQIAESSVKPEINFENDTLSQEVDKSIGGSNDNKDYRLLAEQAVKSIDVNSIQSRVDDLESDNASVRDLAIASLEKETRLSFEGFISYDDIKLERSGRWKNYVDNLKIAVEEKIPIIAEEPAQEGWLKKKEAIEYISVKAPHPAFAPLLRAVITNKEEYYRGGAMHNLSRINHEGLMEFMIQQLTSDSIEVSMAAWQRLSELTYSGITLSRLKPGPSWESADWEKAKKDYEDWWKVNKDAFVYIRDRVMSY